MPQKAGRRPCVCRSRTRSALPKLRWPPARVPSKRVRDLGFCAQDRGRVHGRAPELVPRQAVSIVGIPTVGDIGSLGPIPDEGAPGLSARDRESTAW